MKKIPLFSDTTAYEFDELEDYTTAVFLIERPRVDFLLDTFCGPGYMEPILADRRRRGRNNCLVVINTHFHWDHIWGNCAFENAFIVSHRQTARLIRERWQEQLAYRSFAKGELRMCLPNLTFEKELCFADENILLFYTPGHTEDCISVYDSLRDALYVGDNLERPLIHVESPDLRAYETTLLSYQNRNPRYIFASHTTVAGCPDTSAFPELTPSGGSQTILQESIDYLHDLMHGRERTFSDPFTQIVHEENLSIIH